ncbi:MAG TPA: DUF72 domain-containing protein [Candidatus Bathyarchaeota archaeon]|nr:DUF72 domain-containing protein [Candidatus Bathyarchaeota archaeon]
MKLKVGCCGFCVKGGRAAYYREFSLVELQSTFYTLPRLQTAQKWRSEAPPAFEFVVKCWQAITHPPSSPTWRRAKLKVDPDKRDKYGFLRPTEENFEAWERTLEICRALQSKICVIQCPPSFGYSSENLENMQDFLTRIERDGLKIAWEPRGTWHENPEAIKKLCEKLELIPVVDVLRREPIVVGDTAYTRLHGLNPREYDYRYKYTDEDLKRLVERVSELESAGVSEVYVLFNNTAMADDAKRFIQLAGEHGFQQG